MKNVNPLYTTLKKYAPNITSPDSMAQLVRSYDISLIGRSDLNGNANLYAFLNVTQSINRHHTSFQHGRRGQEFDLNGESDESDVHKGGEMIRGKMYDRKSFVKETAEGGRVNLQTDGVPQGGEISPRSFHSANYYEHKSLPEVGYEGNAFGVEMEKEGVDRQLVGSRFGGSQERRKRLEKEGDEREAMSEYDDMKMRHKYAGVYAQTKDNSEENRIHSEVDGEEREKTNQNDSEVESEGNGNTVEVNESPSVDNTVGSDNQSSNTNSSEDSANVVEVNISTNEDSTAEDNQSSSTNSSETSNSSDKTNDSQRSQNTNSHSKVSESPSDSSSSYPSSSIAQSREFKPKTVGQMLRVQTNVGVAEPGPDAIDTNAKVPRSPSLPIIPKTLGNAPQRGANHDNAPAPKIDLHFNKDLFHNKPPGDAKSTSNPASLGSSDTFKSGLGFRNMTKQFRGIIDIKINQGDEDFIAISGPPYYRPNTTVSSNTSSNSTTQSSTIQKPHETETTQTSTLPTHAQGVSHNNVEPFQWSKSYIKHQKHVGHPDLWDFGRFKANWVWS